VCGVQATVEEDPARVRPPQSEVMVLQSDPSLARSSLGWEAKVSLEEGLERTARWVRANLDRFRPDAYAV
jgi:nucleoside-diphosphate-sugar epimerase